MGETNSWHVQFNIILALRENLEDSEGTKRAGREVSEQVPRGSTTRCARLQAELRHTVNTAETKGTAAEHDQNGGAHRQTQHLSVSPSIYRRF